MINLDDLKFEGVTFVSPSGRFHSYYDMCMMQKDFAVSSAVAKTHVVSDVWGIDSELDFTEHFGPIRYENVTIKMNFTILDGSYDEWFQKVGHRIYNALHGKKVKLILDSDKEYYWEGRAKVTWSKDSKLISDVTIEVDAFPYKRSIKPSVYKLSVTSGTTKTVKLINDEMPTALKITSSSACTLTKGTTSYSLTAGTHEAEFELVEGINQLSITGGGSVVFEWTTGRLM